MGLEGWIKGIRGPTFQLNDDDIVVFLVGPSGCGKSLFVNEVMKSRHIAVGATFRPSTVAPIAIRCELTEEAKRALGVSMQRNIVFVDTPSFHTDENDRVEKETNTWLSKSKCRSTRAGTIYLHRAETNPVYEPVQKHLDSFANTFPPGFNTVPRQVRGVLSYEGPLGKETIESRFATFRTQLESLQSHRFLGTGLKWDTSLHPELFQRDNSETAWKAVVALFSS